MHAADELGATQHLANGQDTIDPGQSPAQDIFIQRLVRLAAFQTNAFVH